MFTRLLTRPKPLLAVLPAAAAPTTCLADDSTTAPHLYYMRRERAARVLTIAATVEPRETAQALRAARSALREQPYSTIAPSERSFLRYALKEGVARGLACAAGGAAASYAILKIVLLVIPLVPSRLVTRLAMSAVSFGAAVVELAAFPDITTVELLLMSDSGLGSRARKSIEEYNPHLLLLQTVDRQAAAPDTQSVVEEDAAELDSFFDREMHFP